MDHRYLQIDEHVEDVELETTYPTDLVKRRNYVLRVATNAVHGDHLIPNGLHVVAGAEKLAKALACRAELLLHAALQANVDGCFLFFELFAKGGDLHEVVRGLEVLANGLRCGYCWYSHGRSPYAGCAGTIMNRITSLRQARSVAVIVDVARALGPAVSQTSASLSCQCSLQTPHMRGASSNIRHAIRSRASPKVLQRYSSASGTNTVGREDSDVVIVGGGPAGLALAGALGAHVFYIPSRSSIFMLYQSRIVSHAAP